MTYTRCWSCLKPLADYAETIRWRNGVERKVHPECVEDALLVRTQPSDRKVKEQ